MCLCVSVCVRGGEDCHRAGLGPPARRGPPAQARRSRRAQGLYACPGPALFCFANQGHPGAPSRFRPQGRRHDCSPAQRPRDATGDLSPCLCLLLSGGRPESPPWAGRPRGARGQAELGHPLAGGWSSCRVTLGPLHTLCFLLGTPPFPAFRFILFTSSRKPSLTSPTQAKQTGVSTSCSHSSALHLPLRTGPAGL